MLGVEPITNAFLVVVITWVLRLNTMIKSEVWPIDMVCGWNMKVLYTPAWTSNHVHSKIWNEVTCPFAILNCCTVNVWECISNSIPYFILGIISYPCRGLCESLFVTGSSGLCYTVCIHLDGYGLDSFTGTARSLYSPEITMWLIGIKSVAIGMTLLALNVLN